MSARVDTGLLLMNVGSPRSSAVGDVRRYLRAFLSDPRVLDMPAWRRRLILELFILPTRPRRSAAAYRAIWTDAGSPLVVHGEALARALQARAGEGVAVRLAMRYGEPALGPALAALRDAGARRLVLLPLFPQRAAATTGSALAAAYEEIARAWDVPDVQVVPPFHDHPRYVAALADLARPHLDAAAPDAVLMSFHGLPERQLRRSAAAGSPCLAEGCCDRPAAAGCYRAQCLATARRLASALRLPPDRVRVAFQSRLGRARWIGPATEATLRELAAAGARRVAVLTPSFVADCLETLEEIGIRGAEVFRAAGGEVLARVPCLNAGEAWADALWAIACDGAPWLARG